MNSHPLPPLDGNVDAWIDSHEDELAYRRWRRRATGGKSLRQLMDDRPKMRHSNLSYPMDEHVIVAAAARQTGVTISGFYRLAVSTYLVENGYANREQIPYLCREWPDDDD